MGQDGGVYEGVGWNIEGSHTYGYNDIALGIAFIGNFVGKAWWGREFCLMKYHVEYSGNTGENRDSIVTLVEIHGSSAKYFRFNKNSQ